MTPVIEGWFTTGEAPALLGTRCRDCGTVCFPRETVFCPNPGCDGETLDEVELSRRGTIWSYTDARYQPPPPYVPRSDPYEPFALAAVRLEEGIVVLGQVADGFGVEDLRVGAVVELVVEELYRDGENVWSTWKWRPVEGGEAWSGEPESAMGPVGAGPVAEDPSLPPLGNAPSSGMGILDATHTDLPGSAPNLGGTRGATFGGGEGGGANSDADASPAGTSGAGGASAEGASGGRASRRVSGEDVVVAGVGMHPWGKWGRSFVAYGVAAAREALRDAGVDWSDVDLCVGGETVRNGYPGYVAGATFAQALGWSGARIATSYAACATGAQALDTARVRILAGLCDVALVVGADTTPKGFLAPNAGDRPDDADWLRFRLLGATNPAYFGLYARRRMELYGATPEDFALVKVKNARHGLANPRARYRQEVTVDEVLASPVVADPLHLLDICATSDGGAAVVLTSAAYARRRGLTDSADGADGAPAVRLRSVATVSPTFPKTVVDLPDIATDSTAAVAPPERGFRASIAHAAYEEAGLGPGDIAVAEVYDLSTALELDWYEDVGLCPPGEAEKLIRDGATALGGRVPVNPSGGLACFGEAVPAQALAQVCELVWQIRGQATGRQTEGARVGLAVNQGLFGHGSAVVVST